jgi:hypothetical protein
MKHAKRAADRSMRHSVSARALARLLYGPIELALSCCSDLP